MIRLTSKTDSPNEKRRINKMKMKNHFKVNYVSVFIIAVLLVVLSGCGLDSDKMKDHFEAGRAGESYEEYMENKNKQETEEAEGGAGTVAKLGDGRRFQGEAVDGSPCMVEQLQTVLTVGG